VNERFVFDTSALITLIEFEPGVDQLEAIVVDAINTRAELFCCFVSLTEVEYTAQQQEGEDVARQRMIELRTLPIQWIHSDDALCSAAAKLKAVHRISFADAFVAATAIRFDATLIHKDPEFLPLGPTLKQLALPPKK
jgi:predicted nucleic acid-binding protein